MTVLGRNKIVGLCLVLMSVLLLMGLPHAASAKPPAYCVSVPEDPVTAYVDYGIDSWWLITLSGVPKGYDVINATYLAWCVDYHTPMTAEQSYTAMLYCSYDPDVPSYFQDEDWDMINYILNHKQGSKEDIQRAIWYFSDGMIPPPGQPLAQVMVDDALANGEGFIPGFGQVMAVLVDIEGQERTIIEVHVPPVVGGTVEAVNPLEPGMTSDQAPADTTTQTSAALWIGLASILAIGAGVLALRRRRAH